MKTNTSISIIPEINGFSEERGSRKNGKWDRNIIRKIQGPKIDEH